jgi:two-component system, chemotaxis family, chemotaxis protein CheY
MRCAREAVLTAAARRSSADEYVRERRRRVQIVRHGMCLGYATMVDAVGAPDARICACPLEISGDSLPIPHTRASVKKILVVDDSATIRRMVMTALRAVANVEFDQAGTGLEAIERLAVAPVDLVVLDLNMPDVHGLEVLRFIRAHESFRDLPVIVLTTRGDEESRVAAEREGATLYMTKPFTPDALMPAVKELLLHSKK